MLAQSPCRRVPLPKVEREEMRFLTPAEVATLADAIAPCYRALVLVGAYGGLRIGELAGLRRGRVDLLRGTVQVAEIVVEVRGVLHMGPPKTRASRRTVGLPRFVVEELVIHLAGPGDLDAFVFTAPEGGPLRVNLFRARVWRPAVTAAGLEGLRIHDLRHTAVALWIAAGANEEWSNPVDRRSCMITRRPRRSSRLAPPWVARPACRSRTWPQPAPARPGAGR